MTFTVSKTVSDETLNCIITIESAGRPNIKASTSSALGLGQFLNTTWLNVVKKHRPDVIEANGQAAVLRMRTEPSFAIEMLARFTEDNQRIVGMKCTGGDLYLAHFLGAGAAQKVYAADPSTPVAGLVGGAAVSANKSVLQGKTAGQVRAWAAKRMFQSSGHDWVAKYYVAPAKVASLLDEPEEAPVEADESADDVPDTQDAPPDQPRVNLPAPKKDDPEIIGKPPEEKKPGGDGFLATTVKLVKSKIQWATSGIGGTSAFALLTDAGHDWRFWLLGAIVLLGVLIIYWRSQKP